MQYCIFFEYLFCTFFAHVFEDFFFFFLGNFFAHFSFFLGKLTKTVDIHFIFLGKFSKLRIFLHFSQENLGTSLILYIFTGKTRNMQNKRKTCAILHIFFLHIFLHIFCIFFLFSRKIYKINDFPRVSVFAYFLHIFAYFLHALVLLHLLLHIFAMPRGFCTCVRKCFACAVVFAFVFVCYFARAFILARSLA